MQYHCPTNVRGTEPDFPIKYNELSRYRGQEVVSLIFRRGVHCVHEGPARTDMLALSATMTFHVSAVERVIADIRDAEGVRPAKIMVGGYPFNIVPELWRRIGADAWAPDAAQAITVADRLLAMPAPS